jgi:hypothetical protein
MSNTHPYCESDLNETRCVILEIPSSPEEGELDLDRILHKLTGHFEDADYEQLLRAHRSREAQDARLYLEMGMEGSGPIEPGEPS